MNARFVGAVLLVLTATPLAAQQAREEEPRTTVRGVVVDARLGDPLPNTMIRLVDQRRGVLTDSLGRFVIADVELGSEMMAVKQYGYEEIDVDIDFRQDHPLLRIELQPGPLALEGFTVIADRLATMTQRLQSRRNAAPVSVRALDQNKLMRSAARDMSQFLWFEGGLMPIDCSSGMNGPGPATSFMPVSNIGAGSGWGSCILRRGRATQPKVFIDESPTIGGIDELASYQPINFYLVEVYSNGREIHAYTHGFMERMARRPMALIPIVLP
jgi:hypothetical protein